MTVGRREAQGNVNSFQKLACFEAVKRQRLATVDEVARWCSLPTMDCVRLLEALKRDGKIEEKNGIFSVA